MAARSSAGSVPSRTTAGNAAKWMVHPGCTSSYAHATKFLSAQLSKGKQQTGSWVVCMLKTSKWYEDSFFCSFNEWSWARRVGVIRSIIYAWKSRFCDPQGEARLPSIAGNGHRATALFDSPRRHAQTPRGLQRRVSLNDIQEQ